MGFVLSNPFQRGNNDSGMIYIRLKSRAALQERPISPRYWALSETSSFSSQLVGNTNPNNSFSTRRWLSMADKFSQNRLIDPWQSSAWSKGSCDRQSKVDVRPCCACRQGIVRGRREERREVARCPGLTHLFWMQTDDMGSRDWTWGLTSHHLSQAGPNTVSLL